VAGSHQNSGSRKRPLGSTWRWKAFWVEQVVSLDGDAMEAVLGAPSRSPVYGPGGDRGATESVRGRSPASHAVDNAAAGWHRESEALGSAPIRQRRGEGSQWSKCTEAGAMRRQAHSTWGRVVARRAGAAVTNGLTLCGGRGRRGESPALGNQAVHGCSCRESVAEVGEEHLPHAIEGSREANRDRAR